MTESNDKFQDLRHRAKSLIEQTGLQPEENLKRSSTNNQKFIELAIELDIHRVELELQNRELQEAQEALRHAKHEYEDLFNNAPCGYLIYNKDGAIWRANKTLADLLDVPVADFNGQSMTDYIAAGSQDAYYLHVRTLIKTNESQRTHLQISAPDGTLHSVVLQSTYNAEDDRIRNCIILSRD